MKVVEDGIPYRPHVHALRRQASRARGLVVVVEVRKKRVFLRNRSVGTALIAASASERCPIKFSNQARFATVFVTYTDHGSLKIV